MGVVTGLVLFGIIGAFVGFVTNKIAIGMLFKDYFGIGNFIEKNHEEFMLQ
jgi:uncharacterized membrane protein YheB (UPF0754 family)